MVAKLFITKFFANQKNKVINRNKFFAYKNNNNNNNHTSLKVERENCHRKTIKTICSFIINSSSLLNYIKTYEYSFMWNFLYDLY